MANSKFVKNPKIINSRKFKYVTIIRSIVYTLTQGSLRCATVCDAGPTLYRVYFWECSRYIQYDRSMNTCPHTMIINIIYIILHTHQAGYVYHVYHILILISRDIHVNHNCSRPVYNPYNAEIFFI